jgi:hypothetical protein
MDKIVTEVERVRRHGWKSAKLVGVKDLFGGGHDTALRQLRDLVGEVLDSVG